MTSKEIATMRIAEVGLSTKRGVKVRAGQKGAYETCWEQNYHDLNDIKDGETYGIAGHSGLVIVDADTKEMDDILARMFNTFRVKSPGRKLHHYYIKTTGEMVENAPKLTLPGSDERAGEIRAQNEYVVGPGSIFPTGEYEITDDKQILELDGSAFNEEMAQYVGDNNGGGLTLEERKGTADVIARHDAANKYIYRLLDFEGNDPETTFDIIKRWGANLANPLVDDKYFRRTIEAAIKKIEEKKIDDAEEKGNYTPNSFFDGYTDKKGVKHQGDFIPKRLAEAIMKDFTFATIEENKEIYVYDEGVYIPYGATKIETESITHLQHHSKKHRSQEAVAYIQGVTYKKAEEFGGELDKIAVANGVINLTTGEFGPHSEKHLFITKIPVKYDPDAKCPKILNFLSEIMNKDDIPVIQEAFGFCLWKEYTYQKSIMLLADGENGKSQLLGLLSDFLGRENTSNHAIHKLMYDRFSTIDLMGKLANIHADIPDGDLGKTGTFKMLTGRDILQGEKKCLQGKIPFKNYAKMFFSTNKLPKTTDTTHAFWRRWILLKLPYLFTDNPVGALQKKRDPDVLRKISTPEEFSGFLNWVIDGLHRLRKNGKFSYSKSSEEIRDEWIASADSLLYFVQKRIESAPKEHINKDDFYKAYCEFCGLNGVDIITTRKVTEALPTILPGTYLGRPGKVEGAKKRPEGWFNIQFISDKPESHEGQTASNSLEVQSKDIPIPIRISDKTDDTDPVGWLGPEIDDAAYEHNRIEIKKWRREEEQRKKRRQESKDIGKSKNRDATLDSNTQKEK